MDVHKIHFKHISKILIDLLSFAVFGISLHRLVIDVHRFVTQLHCSDIDILSIRIDLWLISIGVQRFPLMLKYFHRLI